jgi:tape measure domain-containing protein
MAKLGDLVVHIGANTSKLNKQLGRVQRNMRSMTSNITQLGASMTQAITLPLAGVAAMAVKSAAELEQLETSFVSLTGGVEEAAFMMNRLNEFTAKTPFQIDAVANAARQLIASGTEISEVNDQLQFLGDIAATSGVSIEEIAAIFAKVNAKGKVELENLNQLAERGIPIFKALADATGLPADKLGAGAVSVQQFNDTLKSFAEEGGFAAGAMERLSETAAGKFSTALDNLKLAAASLGEMFLPIVNRMLDGVVSLSKGFANMSPFVKRLLVIVGTFAATLGPLLLIIPKLVVAFTALRTVVLALNFAMLANPVVAVAAGLATLAAVVVGYSVDVGEAAQVTKDWRLELLALNNEGKKMELEKRISSAKDALAEHTEILNRYAAARDAAKLPSEQQKWQRAMESHQEVIDGITTELQAYQDELATVNKALADEEALQRKLNGSTSQVATQFTTLTDIMRNWSTEGRKYTDKVLEGIEEIEEEFEDIELEFDYDPDKVISDFERMRKFIQGVTKDIQSSIQQGIGDALVGMGEAIGQMMQGGLQGAKLLSQSLQFLGNFMKQIGGAMIAQATAMIVFQKTLFTSPLAAAAAGVAFVAAGAALSSYAANLAENNIPALAEGGLAYGATTAIVGDNPNARVDPEVIAPLSKLQDIMGASRVEVFGRISGSDIVLANDRGTRNRNRVI